jgi:hypothetical protein
MRIVEHSSTIHNSPFGLMMLLQPEILTNWLIDYIYIPIDTLIKC